MDVTRVDVPVATRAPTGETAAYILGGGLLVDPAARNDALDDAVRQTDVSDIAVTHHHSDHVGALTHYAEVTGASVWARRGREAAFEAATGRRPDRTFAERTTIPTPGGPVCVLDTPGHTPEHVAFDADGALVSGDLAVAAGSVVVGAPEGDMRAYLSSLRRVGARDPDRLLPGHGPPIDDPRATCERLLRHRLDREQRVLVAVRKGSRTAAEIVDAAYEKDLSGVRDLARATVVAHLEKLDVEGAIRWDGTTANSHAVDTLR